MKLIEKPALNDANYDLKERVESMSFKIAWLFPQFMDKIFLYL